MLQQYLIITILGVLLDAGIILANAFGKLPFGLADFLFVFVIVFAVALWRPRFLFWIFVMLVPLENIVVSPHEFPLSLRPFQFVGVVLILATVVLWAFKKLDFKLLRFKSLSSFDFLVFLLPIFSLLAVINSQAKAVTAKQSLVLISFVALYLLARNYLQTTKQKFEALWFFFVGATSVLVYGIYQAIAVRAGWPHFEVMNGRINSTFTEPDWLGIFLVFLIALILWTKVVFLRMKNTTMMANFEMRKIVGLVLNKYLFFTIFALLLTVARSAWVGMVAVMIVYFMLLLLIRENSSIENLTQNSNLKSKICILKLETILTEGFIILFIGGVSLFVVEFANLSSFHFLNRAASSVSGQQKITVSCVPVGVENFQPVPQEISSIDDLSQYGCKFINLEDIQSQQQQGMDIKEVYRPDPNVAIRKNIYLTVWQEIKKHPILGQGLGSSALILGSDERGSGLNASNIFLEAWISMGIGGLAILIVIFVFPSLAALKNILKKQHVLPSAFVLLTSAAFFIPNLFNAGLFLGFFWLWLSVFLGIFFKAKPSEFPKA